MFRIDVENEYKTRYDPAKFFNREEDIYDITDSYFLERLYKLDRYGIYNVTVEEGRPDLIAERIYGIGKSQYWWILMAFNDIIELDSIKAGTIIKYPSVADLEKIYFSLVPTRK